MQTKIMFNHSGMTLIEILITLTMIGVLSTLAMASYSNLVKRIRIFVATSELHSGLLYSRSEALKYGGNVIICRSINSHTPTPTCEGGPSDPLTNSGWGDGWIIFHDRDADAKVSEDDTILRVQGKLFSRPDQGAILPSPNRKLIRFNSLGQVYGTYMQFAIGQVQSQADVENNRYICIASGGRARVDRKICNAK
jgi:type IV fimbrial biogenesis protein FimT